MYLMKTAAKTTMLHVRVPPRLASRLRALASRRGVAVSNLVREILEYEAAHPALLPRPDESVNARIRSVAKRLRLQPASLIEGWIDEKLSEEAFEEDGLETDRVFSLEERFDLLLQKHHSLAEEIRRTRAEVLAVSEDQPKRTTSVKVTQPG